MRQKMQIKNLFIIYLGKYSYWNQATIFNQKMDLIVYSSSSNSHSFNTFKGFTF